MPLPLRAAPAPAQTKGLTTGSGAFTATSIESGMASWNMQSKLSPRARTFGTPNHQSDLTTPRRPLLTRPMDRLDSQRLTFFGAVRSSVSYTHLRAHETDSSLVCRLLLEKTNV